MNKKVIFIPGNGGGSPNDNWFPSVKGELEAAGLTVIAEEFPDNDLARASFWIPFLINELNADENTILIGHSTGAMELPPSKPPQSSQLVYHKGVYSGHGPCRELSQVGHGGWLFSKLPHDQAQRLNPDHLGESPLGF